MELTRKREEFTLQMKKIFTIFLMLTFNHNVNGQAPKQPMDSLSSDIDFTKVSVREYVELLRIHDKEKNRLHFLSLNKSAPTNWLQKSDVDFLMKYVDSKEPANCVVHIRSSHLPLHGSSTLGGQVMNLIDSFRFKKEYPYFLDDCSKTDKKRVSEIKKWWLDNPK